MSIAYLIYKDFSKGGILLQYFNRDIEDIILQTSNHYSAILLTGPRQVGKTTTLKKLSSGVRSEVSLDDLEARRLAKSDPEMFFSIHKLPIYIDEIQYAPELFSRIKIEVDSGAKPGSFWMSGSQSFRLMELAGESLAGRVAIFHMKSLSQREIFGGNSRKPFELNLTSLQEKLEGKTPIDASAQYERIWNGSMPGHMSGKYPNRNVFYGSFVESYITRDVKDVISGVDDLQFSDFLRAAACRAGQVLNIHALASDVGVSDETAKRWLGVLEKSEVVFYLRPFSNNLLKRTIKTPKMYFFDTGLVAFLTKYSTPEILISGAINGAILENYVVAEIMKSYHNNALEAVCHYYRDKDSQEIDIILECGQTLHPIEVKKTASPSMEMTKQFRLLDKAHLNRGMGAVVCTKKMFSAINQNTVIVPVWSL